MNIFHYKGFRSTPLFKEEENIYFGKIEDITDLVTYESETAEGAYQAFKEAVDDYLELRSEVELLKM